MPYAPTFGPTWPAPSVHTLTTAPPCSLIHARHAHCTRRSGASTFIVKAVRHASGSASMSGPYGWLVAALFTTMSTRPNSATVRSVTSHRCAGSATDPGTPTASAPRARNAATASRTPCGSRAVTHNRAPQSASSSAIARPMPREAPVTTAALPSSTRPSGTRG